MLRYFLIFATLSLALPAAQADIPFVKESELVPGDIQNRSTRIITHIIDTYHYKKLPLDDALSESVLEKYLENLDQNRSFFLQSDVDEFRTKYQHALDDSILQADLTPAYEIFKVFRRRVRERVDYTTLLLEQDYDFSIDEDYQFDRRDTPWADDEDAIKELWRKRVKNDILNLKLSGKEISEIRETLNKRYKRIMNSTFQLKSSDVFQTFINAYTTSIEPHTAYFSPRISENFDISMRLSLEGIGAVLRGDSDYTQVQRIIPGGPADLSGQLKAEDRIIGVGQEKDGEIIDVVGWRLDDVVDLIRGPKGTVLRLEVLGGSVGPEGPSKTITLTRDKIKLEEQSAKSNIIEVPDSTIRIGVIDLPTFYVDFAALARGDEDYRSTTRDVKDLLTDLEKENVQGIVIDLRGNGGGSLAEALDLTGLFIEQGPIVQTRDASGRVEVNSDPDPKIHYSGPLAVLVDRNSASASEIFAGAIQDYKRGIIIGEPTFGKGTVQNIVDLNRFTNRSENDYGKLKTTIAQFFRISGGSNQYKGVIPDIIMPTISVSEEQGERSYDNALPWDKVAPAKFVAASAPVESFNEVRSRHEQRVESDKMFKLLKEELELVREANGKKTVSLKEDTRKQQRDSLMQAKNNLQNEIRLAQGLPPLDLEAMETNDENDAIDETGEDEEMNDIILLETTKILSDLIVPQENIDSALKTVKKVEPQFESNL